MSRLPGNGFVPLVDEGWPGHFCGGPCRFCDGTGEWEPQVPHRAQSGTVTWRRVREPCRMCGATGKCHHEHPERVPGAAFG